MDLNETLTIDLAKYGKTGQIVMCRPSFRKKNAMKNAIGSIVKFSKDMYGGTEISNDRAGDLQIISIMSYIDSAPFDTTLDGFLGYCDELDTVNKDHAENLFNELVENVNRIENGDLSPLVN